MTPDGLKLRGRFLLCVVTVVVAFASSPVLARADPSSSVSGTVLNSNGAGIANAEVTLTSNEGYGVTSETSQIVASTTTDSSGGYSFMVPNANPYQDLTNPGYPSYGIEATAPRYVENQVGLDDPAGASAFPAVTLAPASFTGSVTDTRSGFALDGQLVQLFNSATHRSAAATLTDRNGYYAFPAMDVSAADSYYIEFPVSVSSDQAFYRAGQRDGTSSIGSATLLHPSTVTQTGFDIALAPSKPEITGVVSDGSGPAGSVGVGSGNYPSAPGTVTSDTGTYVLSSSRFGYPEGTSTVVWATPPLASTGTATWHGEVEDPFTATQIKTSSPTATTGVNIKLIPGGTVSGLITNAAGNAIPDVNIDIAGCGGVYTAVTGSDGAYSITGLGSGTYYAYGDAVGTDTANHSAYGSGYFTETGVAGGSLASPSVLPISVVSGASVTTNQTLSPGEAQVTGVLSFPDDIDTPRPQVSGTTQVGRQLTAATGAWACRAAFHYQWYVDGKPIKGATKSVLRLTGADYQKHIKVTVTGEGPGYHPAFETSTPTPLVAAGTLKTAQPRIIGDARISEILGLRTGS